MSKIVKLIGIIAITVVVGFVMIACTEDDPPPAQKTQAEKDANAFKTAHKDILGKSVDSVTINDLDAILAALDAYQEFVNADRQAVLKLLSKEKEKLDAMLAAVMDSLPDEDKFRITHRAILEKNFDDISSADKTAVEAALAAYNSLSQTAKDELIEEIAQLGAFKFKIDYPVIAKTDKTIAVADKAAVNAAGTAFDDLGNNIIEYLYSADITSSIFVTLLGTIEDMEFALANADYILDVIGEVAALRKQNESAPKKSGWTRYEAEDAVKVNSADETQPFYSEGRGVNGIQNPDKMNEMPNDWSTIVNLGKKLAYVKFTVNAASEGDYIIDLIYNGNDNKTILVKYWGMAVPLSLPEVTGQSWNTVFTYRFILKELSEGENEIWISNVFGDDAAWMNIDCIDVIKAGDLDVIDAAAYMDIHGTILNKPLSDLAIEDAPAVTAARNAYNALRASTKALLNTTQDAANKLNALEAKIAELELGATPEELAANFIKQFTENDGILTKEVSDINNRTLENAIKAALDAWAALPPSVKEVQSVIDAKTKLDALKAKLDYEIFWDENWWIVGNDIDGVINESDVNAAIKSYNELSPAAKAFFDDTDVIDGLNEKKAAIDAMWANPLLTRFGQTKSAWWELINLTEGWTRLEAEASIVGTHEELTSETYFSGGVAVKIANAEGVTVASINQNGWGNINHINFPVNVASAGDYLFEIVYMGDNPKNLALQLNNSTTYELHLGKYNEGGEWSATTAFQFLLKGLTEGVNNVRISGRLDNWNDIRIDCLDVRNAPFVRPIQ